MSRSEITYNDWALRVYKSLYEAVWDTPRTAWGTRYEWLVAWAQLEDTGALFNPLATTSVVNNSIQFNHVGVQSYYTLEDGIVAVKRTLLLAKDEWGYGEIVRELLRGDGIFERFREALSRSAWSGSPRNGHYYRIPDYSHEFGARPLPS